MKSYSLAHLTDGALMRDLRTLVIQDRATTAELLAHIAEVDERKLYRPAGYSSMHAYCIGELRMSEDVAFKRIRAARAARDFPAIFPALEDGRLTLSAVVLLAPNLRPETASELLSVAVNKTNAEVELLLAQRFPRSDVPTLVQPIAGPVASELAVRPVDASAPQVAERSASPTAQVAVRPVETLQLAAGVGTPTLQVAVRPVVPPPARIAPLSPERFALQVTINGQTHELLRRAQALLGHTVQTGDVAGVLERALRELVDKLERQKFAKTTRPRPGRSSAKSRHDSARRHVPASIRRTVMQRDGGQCTFVSDSGKRCESRTSLEFDHVDPVARGGQTSAGNLRLRCRAHNQYAAECTFGAAFMRGKREQARTRPARSESKAEASVRTQARVGVAMESLSQPAP